MIEVYILLMNTKRQLLACANGILLYREFSELKWDSKVFLFYALTRFAIDLY